MAQATKCDNRCLYAMEEGDCDCVCGGKNHGKGDATEIRAAQAERHGKTKRAFKEYLDSTIGKKERRRLYRDRDGFNAQYAKWLVDNGHTVDSAGMKHDKLTVDADKYEVIKHLEFAGVNYKHVRYPNKKTAYLADEKVITKAKLPKELGW